MRVPFMKHVSWYLVIAMFVIGIAPRVDASFSPSGVIALPHTDRVQDLNKIQQTLENKMVSRRLADLGFSQKEINSRLSQMSDQQIHQVAQKLGSLKVGGDGVEFVIALLVVVVLVILILQMTGHKVIVR
ncbi:MAG: PA2779 family protein [Nitrospiraceae bacterium]|nr:PA2779 family protein [Nitrospiraceae bacterium]MDA8089664.1 PA2779 family protein [Nitrospiraceae bacterium]